MRVQSEGYLERAERSSIRISPYYYQYEISFSIKEN
jgi:hypothetical protein